MQGGACEHARRDGARRGAMCRYRRVPGRSLRAVAARGGIRALYGLARAVAAPAARVLGARLLGPDSNRDISAGAALGESRYRLAVWASRPDAPARYRFPER